MKKKLYLTEKRIRLWNFFFKYLIDYILRSHWDYKLRSHWDYILRSHWDYKLRSHWDYILRSHWDYILRSQWDDPHKTVFMRIQWDFKWYLSFSQLRSHWDLGWDSVRISHGNVNLSLNAKSKKQTSSSLKLRL